MIDQDIRLEFNKKIAEGTYFLGFESPEIVSAAKPGQFVMIRMSGGTSPLLRRPFSICGINNEKLVCILYRVIGQGTAMISQKKSGETITVLGPLGQGFELPKGDEKPILVAGGIGIAPLIYLSQVLEREDIEFMSGFCSSNEIVDTALTYNPVKKMSLATDDGTRGYKGFVTDLLDRYLRQNIADKNRFSVFSCGPSPMLKAVASIALKWNVPCQVSLEARMACGLGACQGCAVKARPRNGETLYYHVCKDGPVFDFNDIGWGDL